MHNNCRVAPAEIPGAISVSAVGPIGITGYTHGSRRTPRSVVDIAGPGGDYFAATGTVQDAVIGAWTSTDEGGTWDFFDFLNDNGLPGLAVESGRSALGLVNEPRWLRRTSRVSQRWSSSGIRVGALRLSRRAFCGRQRPWRCPPDWHPESGDDTRTCTGGTTTSFFGHGLVNAAAAAAG